MAYLSLYRKWRPQSFDDVVGQHHVVRTLVNALNDRRTAHAYLFCGPRGTGKTTVARLLAKGLNCEQGPTGQVCNECENCRRVAAGSALDVIEIDGASNRGIDEVREIRERVHYAPTQGQYKVYIVDEVHMLTNEAFNALLKILEEPPAHVVFVFATTEAHKIPATITSRCQRFDFHRFRPSELVGQLRKVLGGEGVAFEEEALNLVARHAEGGMRDALAVLDQCIAYQPERVTVQVVNEVLGSAPRTRLVEFVRHNLQGEVGAVLALVRELDETATDLRQFARDLLGYLRDLMILKASGSEADRLTTLLEGEREEARALAAELSLDKIIKAMEIMGQVEADMRWAPSPALALEMACVRLSELFRSEPHTPSATPQVTADPVQISTPRPVTGERAVPEPSRPRSGGMVASPADRASQRPTEPVPGGDPGARISAPASASRPPVEETGPTSIPGPAREEELQGLWSRLLQALRDDRLRQAEAFLREATPVLLTQSTLIVSFPTNREFHHASAGRPEHKQPVERVLSRLVGRNLSLDLRLGEVVLGSDEIAAAGEMTPADESGSGQSQQQPSAPVSTVAEKDRPPTPAERGPSSQTPDEDLDAPTVKAALRLFGGTITEVRHEEENAP